MATGLDSSQHRFCPEWEHHVLAARRGMGNSVLDYYVAMRYCSSLVANRLVFHATLQQGAELVCFVAVNDPYVMRAWEESQKAKGKVLMLSDGNGDLSAAVRRSPAGHSKHVVVMAYMCGLACARLRG